MSDVKCWCCGNKATKTSRRGNYTVERYRCYCADCFKKFIETEEHENQLFIYLKHKRMLMSALTIMEDQQVNMYKYKEAIDVVSEYIENNPDKFDSSYEVLAAIILINSRIHIKPQYEIGRYHVDFYLPEVNIILEIDGDRHRANKGKDSARDLAIKSIMNNGVDIVRISTDYLDENARKLPEAIKRVHKYHREGKVNWRELYG